MSSASLQLHKTLAMFFKSLLLSKLLDKYHRTAFQPGSFDENLDSEALSFVAEVGIVQAAT